MLAGQVFNKIMIWLVMVTYISVVLILRFKLVSLQLYLSLFTYLFEHIWYSKIILCWCVNARLQTDDGGLTLLQPLSQLSYLLGMNMLIKLKFLHQSVTAILSFCA